MAKKKTGNGNGKNGNGKNGKKKKNFTFLIILVILLIGMLVYFLVLPHYKCIEEGGCKWDFLPQEYRSSDCDDNCSLTEERVHCLNVHDTKTNSDFVYCNPCKSGINPYTNERCTIGNSYRNHEECESAVQYGDCSTVDTRVVPTYLEGVVPSYYYGAGCMGGCGYIGCGTCFDPSWCPGCGIDIDIDIDINGDEVEEEVPEEEIEEEVPEEEVPEEEIEEVPVEEDEEVEEDDEDEDGPFIDFPIDLSGVKKEVPELPDFGKDLGKDLGKKAKPKFPKFPLQPPKMPKIGTAVGPTRGPVKQFPRKPVTTPKVGTAVGPTRVGRSFGRSLGRSLGRQAGRSLGQGLRARSPSRSLSGGLGGGLGGGGMRRSIGRKR